jgi:hypothetical protein
MRYFLVGPKEIVTLVSGKTTIIKNDSKKGWSYLYRGKPHSELLTSNLCDRWGIRDKDAFWGPWEHWNLLKSARNQQDDEYESCVELTEPEAYELCQSLPDAHVPKETTP